MLDFYIQFIVLGLLINVAIIIKYNYIISGHVNILNKHKFRYASKYIFKAWLIPYSKLFSYENLNKKYKQYEAEHTNADIFDYLAWRLR